MAVTLFEKNYPKFESFMRDVCRIHGIKILKKDSEDNFELGLFYTANRQPVIEIPTYIGPETFLIIAHEFGHALQYLAKDENLVGKFERETPTAIWSNWLQGKEYAPEFIYGIKQRMKILELDAEIRLIEFNRIFKLGFNEKILWKKAYSYVYQLEYQYQYRTDDMQVYHLKRSVLSQMPDNAKAKQRVLSDASPGVVAILRAEHLKIIS